jgi:predicted MPP superfamily phosphohydrolase
MSVCFEKMFAEEVGYETLSKETLLTVPALSSREESRFERRRSFENLHRTGSDGVRGRVYRRWHDYCLAGLLETGLKITGQHRRGIANALSPVIRHVPLEFPGLPLRLEGYRILHLSDLHIDGVDGLAEILAEQLPSVPVDLCVLTGDYRFQIYGPCDAIYPRMHRVLQAVRSRHGVVGILGNHDCAEIAIALEQAGVRMLMNEAVGIGHPDDGLWAVGVDDSHYYDCADLGAAVAGVPEGVFKLLLAHSPEMYEEAASANIDLYLAGHTHAGQIRLPLLGPLALHADCPRSYTSGHWIHSGMKGYTSAGLGCSLLPVRFGCPPEISVIELRRS